MGRGRVDDPHPAVAGRNSFVWETKHQASKFQAPEKYQIPSVKFWDSHIFRIPLRCRFDAIDGGGEKIKMVGTIGTVKKLKTIEIFAIVAIVVHGPDRLPI